jgi:hypothetical protein
MAKTKKQPTPDTIYDSFLDLDFDQQLELHNRQKAYLEDKAQKKIDEGNKAHLALKQINGKQ